MRKYEKKEVEEIVSFVKLQDILSQEIRKYRNIIIKTRDLSDDLPEGIQFCIRRIAVVKKTWIEEGWVNEGRHDGLVPVGPGAIEPLNYVFVREYMRVIDMKRKYPEFNRLPPDFDKDYEAAKQVLERVNHADFQKYCADDYPKDLTLESIAYTAEALKAVGYR